MGSVYEWFIQKTGKKPDPEPNEEKSLADEFLVSPTLTLGRIPYPTYQMAVDPIDNEYDKWKRERDMQRMIHESMIKRERIESQYREMRIQEQRINPLQVYSPRDYTHMDNIRGQGIREQISNTERSVVQSQQLNDGYKEHMLFTGRIGYQTMQEAMLDYKKSYEKMAMYSGPGWWDRKIVLNANTRTI